MSVWMPTWLSHLYFVINLINSTVQTFEWSLYKKQHYFAIYLLNFKLFGKLLVLLQNHSSIFMAGEYLVFIITKISWRHHLFHCHNRRCGVNIELHLRSIILKYISKVIKFYIKGTNFLTACIILLKLLTGVIEFVN